MPLRDRPSLAAAFLAQFNSSTERANHGPLGRRPGPARSRRPPPRASVSASSAGAIGVRVPDRAEGFELSSARLAWLQATSRRRLAMALWLSLTFAIAVPALLP